MRQIAKVNPPIPTMAITINTKDTADTGNKLRIKAAKSKDSYVGDKLKERTLGNEQRTTKTLHTLCYSETFKLKIINFVV